MNETSDSISTPGTTKLSKLELLLLPLVALLTVGTISGFTEWIARKETRVYSNCELRNDGTFGARLSPNSTCVEKEAETPPVRYQINSCGHRADVECGPKPAGVYRIAVIGTSTAFGSRVPWEETFSARLPKQLTRQTGHTVQIYNDGILELGSLSNVASRMNEVLAEQHDLVLLAVSPWDVQSAPGATYELQGPVPAPSLSTPNKAEPPSQSLLRVIKSLGKDSKAAFWLRHFMLKSESQLLAASLSKQGSTGFLRSDFSPAWRDHLRAFDYQFARIAGSAAAAKVPVSVVLMPNRAEAAMVWMGTWPAGSDPYKLDRELQSIVNSHGGIYLDILPGLRNIPDPGNNYYPMDGHLDGNGHEMISELLAEALIASPIPELKVSRPTPTGWGIPK